VAKRQQIEFIIKSNGVVEERVSGISGPACEAVTEAIERALGEVEHRDHLSDFYSNTNAGQPDNVTTSS
jgi:hypothetical protein